MEVSNRLAPYFASARILVIAMISGIFWLGQLDSKVESLRDEVRENRREISNTRQEISNTRQEILDKIDESNQRMLDALAGHTHNAEGKAVFVRPP